MVANKFWNSLAFAEMTLVVSKLLWNFDLELSPESNRWMQNQKIYITWKQKPLEVDLRLRHWN